MNRTAVESASQAANQPTSEYVSEHDESDVSM